jgi:hypothetical protein
MRDAFFWDFYATQNEFLIDVSGQRNGPILKGQAVKPWIALHFMRGPLLCPETSVRNYHSTLRKIRKERKSSEIVAHNSRERH